MDGVLNVNKPAGVTSHDVVSAVRRILQTRRVGHAGALDPLATGVLPVCVGQATRIVEFLMAEEKEYQGEMTLGVTTDTEDSSGRVTSEADASHVTMDQIQALLPRFTGRILQAPPMVSAAHYEGKRLYQLAREGKVVERQPRQVEVKEIEVLGFQPGAHPRAELRVVCSKGLYIRTLFAEIGAALGVGASMSALTRTRVGKFTLADSVSLEFLASLAQEGRNSEVMISMAYALEELPHAAIPRELVTAVKHGRTIPITEDFGSMPAHNASDPVLLIADGEVVALAKVVQTEDGAAFQPTKVFV